MTAAHGGAKMSCMSEPTYLIRVQHEPTEPTLPWSAIVMRVSDGTHCVTRWGTSQQEAVEAAQAWMRAKATAPEPPREFIADKSGEIIVGESVRVLRP